MYTDVNDTDLLTDTRAFEQELCSEGIGGSALRRVVGLDVVYGLEGDTSALEHLPVLASAPDRLS